MTDQPRETLCKLIATYGRTLCDDPRRCEALLRDLCGVHRREIHALISALRERIAEDLLAASEGMPREMLWARLTQRLQDNLGLTEDLARWAVDSWALALGKLSRTELSDVSLGKAVSEGNLDAEELSPAELNTPSLAPSASSPASIGWRQRLRSPALIVIGLGVAAIAVVVVAVMFLRNQSAGVGSEHSGIPTQPPAQLDRGTNLNKARPYPFGLDVMGYLKSKSFDPEKVSDIWRKDTHFYCMGSPSEKRSPVFCVLEQGGRVGAITLPMYPGERDIKVEAFLLARLKMLGFTEVRDGEDYLRESSYTSNEVGNGLVVALRKLRTDHSRAPIVQTFGQYSFSMYRTFVAVSDARISPAKWTLENKPESGIYLKGEQETSLGIGKIVLGCVKDSFILSAFYGVDNAETIASTTNRYSLRVDDDFIPISTVETPRVRNGWVIAQFELTQDQLDRIRVAKSLGFAFHLLADPDIFSGFVVDASSGRDKISSFVEHCLSRSN